MTCQGDPVQILAAQVKFPVPVEGLNCEKVIRRESESHRSRVLTERSEVSIAILAMHVKRVKYECGLDSSIHKGSHKMSTSMSQKVSIFATLQGCVSLSRF